MTEVTTYGVNAIVYPHPAVWGWQVALYIFLGGTAAGLMVVAALLALLGGREKQPGLSRAATFTALPMLCLGLFLLWIDLGDRLNFFRLYLHFAPTSAISWGAWIILLAMLLLAVEAWSEIMTWEAAPRAVQTLQRLLARTKPLLHPLERSGRALPALTVVVELALAAYTGVLLSSLAALPLWHSLLVPAAFVASALACGSAFAAWLATGELRRRLLWAMAGLAALQAVLGGVYVATMHQAMHQAGNLVAGHLLLGGGYALAFWGGFVLLGSVAAAAAALWAAARPRGRRLLAAAALGAVLLGSLTLRLVVVYAGELSHL